jgi:hypothetical protein
LQDVAYGTGEMLGWLIEREITPRMPVWDKKRGRSERKVQRSDDIFPFINPHMVVIHQARPLGA